MKNKVLVIDDEKPMLRAITRQLETDDDEFEIFSAYNGQEGLQLYQKEKPLLIILDIHMPCMGGIEFLEEIRLTPSSPSSAIVLTGKGSNQYIEKCFDLGVSAFMKKPFNNFEFMGLVRNSIALKHTQVELREEIAYRRLTQKALADQKETFISVLMHDLKNPLIPLAGYSKKLAEGKIKSEKEMLEKLQIMRESSEKILDIIESTSDSIKQRGAVPPACMENIKINDILLFVVKNHLNEAEDRSISITVNGCMKDEWCIAHDVVMHANEHQVRSIIENLLSNAMKYAKSRINLELGTIGSNVKLVVSDDGPGIKSRYHQKIFDSYFQIPGSKKGSGLGLYSVKRVVDTHKGQIYVYSTHQNGTRFEVVFPLNNGAGTQV